MKVNYDRATDTLTIIFTGTMIVESDDDKGNLVSHEILDASQRVNVPSKIEYQVPPMTG